jgi:hypothetical protein
MKRCVRTALWLGAGALLASPLPAFFAVPIPASITVALAVVAVLAAWRPRDALLVVAALSPLAGAVHALSGAPYDAPALLEVFVLALLAGAALRASARAAPLPGRPFDLCVLALIALALASCLALLPMAALRGGTDAWPSAVWTLLTREYFLHPEHFVIVQRTALLVEGGALAILVAHALRSRSDALRLSAMIVVGGVSAAVLNLYRLLEVSLRRGSLAEALIDALLTLRLNTQYSDLNAAGSYFALVTILAACHAGIYSTRARLHLAAVLLLGGALWITGSRVALAAAFLGTLVVILGRRYGGRLRWPLSRRALLMASAALLVLFVSMVFLLSAARHGSFRYSVATRAGLVEAGLRMVGDRPLLGVGVSQYYALFPRYVPEDLHRLFAQELGYEITHENAHNQFVQVLAELGVLGLAAFLALLACALWGWRSSERWRLAAVAAVGGFLLTAMAGHPLLIPMVSVPFWTVLGLAAAGRNDTAAPGDTRTRRRLAWGLAGLLVLLAATMPWRWRLERADADLAGVTLGLSGWQTAAAGERFRRAEGRATLFVPREAARVTVPLRSTEHTAGLVEVVVDGRLAGVVRLDPGRWSEAVVPFPEVTGRPRYRRLDLILAPAGPPRRLQPGFAGRTNRGGRALSRPSLRPAAPAAGATRRLPAPRWRRSSAR